MHGSEWPEAIWALDPRRPPSGARYFHAVIPRKASGKGQTSRFLIPLFPSVLPRAPRSSTDYPDNLEAIRRYYLCLHNHVPVFTSYFHAVTAPPRERNELFCSPFSPEPPCFIDESNSYGITRVIPMRFTILCVFTQSRPYARARALFLSCRRGETTCFRVERDYGITEAISRYMCIHTFSRYTPIHMYIRPCPCPILPCYPSSPPLAPSPSRCTPTCRCARVIYPVCRT